MFSKQWCSYIYFLKNICLKLYIPSGWQQTRICSYYPFSLKTMSIQILQLFVYLLQSMMLLWILHILISYYIYSTYIFLTYRGHIFTLFVVSATIEEVFSISVIWFVNFHFGKKYFKNKKNWTKQSWINFLSILFQVTLQFQVFQ